MKTTVELNDVLLEQARDLAHREGRTLKSVLEEALHALLVQRGTAGGFVLEDCSVGRGGLREEWSSRSMNDVIADSRERDLA